MKVSSNGLEIHVKPKGARDLTLVFLHYYGGSSRTWKHITANQAGLFNAVGEASLRPLGDTV